MVDESEVRTLCDSGRIDDATSLALRAYGSELYGYLVGVSRDETLADDAFSLFAERLWRTLSAFRWTCSLRSWVYLLGRNALTDVRRAGTKRAVPLSQISDIALEVRSETAAYLRTAVKSKLQTLRETLPEEDQTLLILRIDKRMSWQEIAIAVSGIDADRSREAARLRKRYQLVKDEFVALARSQGLVATD